MTLPLIYALSQSDRSQKKHIIQSIKKHSTKPKVIKEVIKFVKDRGGLEYAEAAMHNYKNKALKTLDSFPTSDAKEAMRDLVNFVIDRKK